MDRLCGHATLLRVRARHRGDVTTLCAHQRGFLSLRPVDPRVGDRAGIHIGQPGRSGGDRDGSVGREVWHRYEPLLLGRRHPGHDLPRPVHDAVLLRVPGPFGPRVPAPPLRREDPCGQRRVVRRDDRILVGHLALRHGEASQPAARLELRREHPGRGVRGPRVHLPGRPHECDLQRGAAVLPDRAWAFGPSAAGPGCRPGSRSTLLPAGSRPALTPAAGPSWVTPRPIPWESSGSDS